MIKLIFRFNIISYFKCFKSFRVVETVILVHITNQKWLAKQISLYFYYYLLRKLIQYFMIIIILDQIGLDYKF